MGGNLATVAAGGRGHPWVAAPPPDPIPAQDRTLRVYKSRTTHPERHDYVIFVY